MRRPTLGWTDRHTGVAALVGLSVCGVTAALTESGALTFLVAAAMLLAAVGGLGTDVLGGLLVGLVVAAALIGLRMLMGTWDEEFFASALVETTALIAVGGGAGSVAVRLRRRDSPEHADQTLAFSAMGLLHQDAAFARLDEEVQRAREHERPLSLVLLEVSIDGGLPPVGRDAALRAVSRLVQSRVHEHDVPFAVGEDRFGVIMPETAATTAWERVGDILDAISNASFVYGEDRTAGSLSDTVQVHAGVARLTTAVESSDALFDAATAAVARSRDLEAGG